jgi:hypothetical protein
MAKNKDKNLPKMPFGQNKAVRQFGSQVILAILILMIFVGIYSIVVGKKDTTPVVALSKVAEEVMLGQVAKISVQGEDLTVTLKDKSLQKTKKEVENLCLRLWSIMV